MREGDGLSAITEVTVVFQLYQGLVLMWNWASTKSEK